MKKIGLIVFCALSMPATPNPFVQEHENYTQITRDTAIAFGVFCAAAFGFGGNALRAIPTKILRERRRANCYQNVMEILRTYDAEAQASREQNATFIDRYDQLHNVDLYALLELNEFATEEQINTAYRQLNRNRHTNRIQQNLQNQRNNDEITQEQFDERLEQAKRATADRHEAQQILTNPVQRRLYDTMRASPELIREAQQIIERAKAELAERQRMLERMQEDAERIVREYQERRNHRA